MAELTYAQKFALLEPWLEEIFTAVKKDLRDEHLKKDRNFFKRYFPGKEIGKIEVKELLQVYPKLIQMGSEPLGEFVSNRWLLRHLEIYNFFEMILKGYSERFEEIEVLPEEVSRPLIEEASERFGASNCYIFSLLNAVAFPPNLLTELKNHASQVTSTT